MPLIPSEQTTERRNPGTYLYKNATYALVGELQRLLQVGTELDSRNGPTIELIQNAFTIENPLERIPLTPNRNDNIFAKIAETWWVMAGRNDIAYLSRYLPRAADYSDDGQTWRAGYGPRLRNWQKRVDQMRAVTNLLIHDQNTRRAVIVIFDPEQDFQESRDIPCNNWLHFLVRNGKLHLNVSLRSNDVIWGFSGINTFEWSVLQEMIASWVRAEVGPMTYFVGSFHLYTAHKKRAESIIRGAREKTVYDDTFAFTTPRFDIPLEEFDGAMDMWFALETRMRAGDTTVLSDIEAIPYAYLRLHAQMLYIYNLHLNGGEQFDTREEIASCIASLPESDMKIAAIEYFTRIWKDRTAISLTEREKRFFAYYWGQK